MNEPTRYDLVHDAAEAKLEPHRQGDWVRYESWTELAGELDDALAKLEKIANIV